ncbi:hypothetical protein HOLleu_13687 [Holothuria leucospilota]|uniref:Uncharacterized protein n=1 Tax=Holothuria leucospilota TaxID=206669 RepID=A0A9Q1HBX5_HOLLE|nr:hypothetical protein HOLleu_13687 [Holothuria leucospilota]
MLNGGPKVGARKNSQYTARIFTKIFGWGAAAPTPASYAYEYEYEYKGSILATISHSLMNLICLAHPGRSFMLPERTMSLTGRPPSQPISCPLALTNSAPSYFSGTICTVFSPMLVIYNFLKNRPIITSSGTLPAHMLVKCIIIRDLANTSCPHAK